MPRESKINFLRIRTLLENPNNNCIDSRGKLRPPKDLCWRTLSAEYGDIDPKYLYTIVLENRHNVLGVADAPAVASPSNSSCSTDDSELSSPTSETVERNFSISIETEYWRKLLVEETYSDKKLGTRTYKTLKPRFWTDVFNSQFFEKTRLLCNLVFKRARIQPSGEFYFKFVATCCTCHSQLEGVLNEEPKLDTNEKISVDCCYKGDFQNCHSTRKRRVIGERRQEYTKKMVENKMSASFLRRTEAKRMMKFGEHQPSHLPSDNALRLMKSHESKKPFPHDDPVLSLAQLKAVPPYNEAIRDIGLDGFFVHYWSKTELSCYRMATRQNKFLTGSIDATGSVVHRIQLPSNEKSHHIFLYEVVVQDKKNCTNYAVCHMLSSRHNSNAINYWLQEWIRSDIEKSPASVITDSSMALTHAVCRTFTQYSSIWEYINVCACFLLSPKTQPSNVRTLPTCFIRNDFNHTMHTLLGWNEIKTASKNTKNFYLLSLALMVGCAHYEELKQLMESFFIACLSRENGEICLEAKARLKHQIAGHAFSPDIEDKELSIDEPPFADEDTDIDSSISAESDAVYKRAFQRAGSESCRSNDDNPIFSDVVAQKLRKFSRLLPIWSAVMVPIFQYGAITESSAASEGSYNDVKNRIFQHKKLPIRVDDFVTTHCNAIIGKMNLIKAESLSTDIKDESPPQFSESDVASLRPSQKVIDEKSPELQKLQFPEENWRGLNEDRKPPRKRMAYRNSTSSPQIKNHPICLSPVCAQIAENKTPEISPGKSEISPEKQETYQTIITISPDIEKIRESETSPKKHIQLRTDPVTNIQKPRTRKRKNYLTPDPTILYANEFSRARTRIIGLMKNGNLDNLLSVKISDSYYLFRNTCPFDSVMQVLFVCYADSSEYAKFVDEQNYVIFQMIRNAVRDGITVQTYRKRAHIFIDLQKTSQDPIFRAIDLPNENHVEFNCASTAFVLIERLLADHPSSRSTRNCRECLYNTERKFASVSVTLPTDTLQFFQDCLIARLSPLKDSACWKCEKKSFDEELAIEKHLFLEISTVLTDETRDAHLDICTNLSDIPTEIELPALPTMYKLRGAISFIAPNSKHMNAVGHYVAYCYRYEEKTWELHDDLRSEIRPARPSTCIPRCQFLIYTI